MITQYRSDQGGYSTPSADIQNIVANNVSILDQYILMQTGQYEYTALIRNPATGKTREIVIRRTANNSQYTVSRGSTEDFSHVVSNEYYVVSNIGVGRSMVIPATQGTIAYSLAFICCLCAFAVMFKGVLFRCLRKR